MTKLFKPTESELEILCILWDKENATVKEVHEVVQKTKEVGYTTTLKLMQIMNTKGLVSRNIQSKKHIYTPTLKKEKAQDHPERLISLKAQTKLFLIFLFGLNG